MSVYISLLRGINVGGARIISMGALCELYSGLGFTRIRTYLQSGNVVFESPLKDQSQLGDHIEASIEQMYGYRVTVFMRDAQDFGRIIAGNPFQEEARSDPARLHVSFLYHDPPEAAWGKLDLPAGIPDRLARGDRAVYLYYPNGAAKTKIPSSYLEKALGVPITDRNWNTVNALYRLATEQ